MFSVASINLYFTITIQNDLNLYITTVQKTFRRASLLAKARASYRILFNTANGIVRDRTELIPEGRSVVYRELLTRTVQEISDI
jgi:hypothetical protein